MNRMDGWHVVFDSRAEYGHMAPALLGHHHLMHQHVDAVTFVVNVLAPEPRL